MATTFARGLVLAFMMSATFTSSGMAQRLPAPEAPPAAAPAPPEPARRILPALDLAGGVTFVRPEPGPDLDRATLPGWQISFGAQPFSRLGLVAEVASSRRTNELSDSLAPDAPVRLQQTTFLIGPSVRLLQRGRLSSRFRAMIGVAHHSAEFPDDAEAAGPGGANPGGTPQQIGAFEDETTFAAAFGTAWDVRTSRHLAVRVNPSLMISRLNGDTQITPRFTTSLVWWIRPPQGKDR